MKGFIKLFQKKGDPMVRLIGQHCSLCTFTPADAKALAKLLSVNKHFWSIHEPLHHDEFYTEETQYQKILEGLQMQQMNREFSFGIYDQSSKKLIGHIALYSIKRMPYLSGFIGYSIDKNFTGRGITTEAVLLVLQFAFQTLNLHRVEAYVSPQNSPSIRVLEKSGFKQEGLLRELLFINGVWVDHYMYAILQNEYYNTF